MSSKRIELTPSAGRLTNSLRDIGYEFVTAVADLVDNSVSAGASTVDVLIDFRGSASRVLIVDDGEGMTAAGLDEAMRFGTRRNYSLNELGRYGLGLKTASISQCRRLTVISRRAAARRRLTTRVLDIDHVEESDSWEVLDAATPAIRDFAAETLAEAPGTVVAWERLDRVLPERNPEGGWARRRLDTLADRTSEYLGMVFHRYLADSASADRLVLTVNGEKVDPWDPFAPTEPGTISLPGTVLEIEFEGVAGFVTFNPFVLPPRNRFSSQEAFDHYSGPQKWNRQQGLYVYRAGRLIQGGGWSGIRAIDEHTKLARASLEFDTNLDDLLQTNVAKMRVNVPASIRSQLERPVKELCQAAEEVYRQASVLRERTAPSDRPASHQMGTAGASLLAAAMATGDYPALERIMTELRATDEELATALGW
ncbi:MAG: ATP-binding protein [Acidimicrobiales bacterium]|nr:ATP-binding protein [Acidimicrobiales bacterium]